MRGSEEERAPQFIHGLSIAEIPATEGVKEVAWTGGNLPEEWYDEFVLRVRLPDGAPGTVIRFPVVQECVEGVHRWIEVPVEGQDPDLVPEPAPFVTLTEKAG